MLRRGLFRSQGKRFGDLYLHYDDATPIGLCSTTTGHCRFNPASKAIVQPDDFIVITRPSRFGRSSYRPMEEAHKGTLGVLPYCPS